MRSVKGFTLIELMVTIAVLAIIAMMAAPTFTDIIRKNQLKVTARDFKDNIVNLRSEAILKQKDQIFIPSGVGAWTPNDQVEWSENSAQPTSLTYSMMGLLKSDKNLCFVLKHKKDSDLKAIIIARRSGIVTYDQTLSGCPSDLGSE